MKGDLGGGQVEQGDPEREVSWVDRRQIVLDGYVTNRMLCEASLTAASDPNSCSDGGARGLTRLSDCAPCPCKPYLDLEHPSNQVSPYTVEMCRFLSVREKCRHKRVALVGFGLGILSTCLPKHCPNMSLTTVDIDAQAALHKIDMIYMFIYNKTK